MRWRTQGKFRTSATGVIMQVLRLETWNATFMTCTLKTSRQSRKENTKTGSNVWSATIQPQLWASWWIIWWRTLGTNLTSATSATMQATILATWRGTLSHITVELNQHREKIQTSAICVVLMAGNWKGIWKRMWIQKTLKSNQKSRKKLKGKNQLIMGLLKKNSKWNEINSLYFDSFSIVYFINGLRFIVYNCVFVHLHLANSSIRGGPGILAVIELISCHTSTVRPMAVWTHVHVQYVLYNVIELYGHRNVNTCVHSTVCCILWLSWYAFTNMWNALFWSKSARLSRLSTVNAVNQM